MKSLNRSNRQSGFVDLGMSLIVILLAGGVAYGVESSKAEQQNIATVQPSMAESSGEQKADTVAALQ
ncbi:MAG: hypothetical protein PVI79_17695 [Gammaproteobacteria bacterium]|jgi:hypothetical protein